MISINGICKAAHANAVEKGFYERKRDLPELAMLVVGELSEAVEAERLGEEIKPQFQDILRCFAKPETWQEAGVIERYETIVRGSIEEEIADTFIRLFDICGYYDIDIDAAIRGKMLYNSTRPAKHGKRY